MQISNASCSSSMNPPPDSYKLSFPSKRYHGRIEMLEKRTSVRIIEFDPATAYSKLHNLQS